jgi:predicted transcriptional regulator
MTMTADREPLVLEENLHRLIRDYEQRVHEFEGRYEIHSGDLAAELAAGRLRETAEVAEWVIAWRTLEALRREVTATPVA